MSRSATARRTHRKKWPQKAPELFSALNIESFSYLPVSEFPVLLLGIHIPHSHFREDSFVVHDYRFKEGREWKRIAHQTAGVACHQRYWIGTVIEPKPSVKEIFAKIAAEWYGSCLGLGGFETLDIIAQYRDRIRELLGADCNVSYPLLEEGHYPVDIEDLGKLTDEYLPNDLDDLIEWKSGLDRAIGCANRWGTVLLANNSD